MPERGREGCAPSESSLPGTKASLHPEQGQAKLRDPATASHSWGAGGVGGVGVVSQVLGRQ